HFEDPQPRGLGAVARTARGKRRAELKAVLQPGLDFESAMSLTPIEQSLLLGAYFRGMPDDESGWSSNSDQIVTLSLFYTGDLSPKECASRFVTRTQCV